MDAPEPEKKLQIGRHTEVPSKTYECLRYLRTLKGNMKRAKHVKKAYAVWPKSSGKEKYQQNKSLHRTRGLLHKNSEVEPNVFYANAFDRP